MEYVLKIMSVDKETPDTQRIIVHKPVGFTVIPGKSIMVAINRPGLESTRKPFAFTSLNSDYYIEFIAKEKLAHDRFYDALRTLRAGEELILSDVVGNFEYKGKGTFIALGEAVAPFIAILRQLKQDSMLQGNSLIFVGKTKDDLICERELRHMLDKNCTVVLTRENQPGYDTRKVDGDFLKSKIHNINQNFYICGPDSFIKEVQEALQQIGATSIFAEVMD
jgi:ferredoxin-NADP reductase